MEGSSGIKRDGTRRLLNVDEVGGKGKIDPPYARRGVKLAQAVVSRTRDGQWKIFAQSDNHVETMLVGSLDDIVRELEDYSHSDWEMRS